MDIYFVKSLEEDFVSKTLRGKRKVPFQKVENMVKTKTIKPNTLSFGRKMRLACTILDTNYTKTYRAHGIIFQTKQKPASISPFDLVLLSNAKKLIVQYYRIKDNLHLYYGHKLAPGYEKFMFKDFKKMIKKYPSPSVAWKAANKFRMARGHKRMSKQKYRLALYNEVIFHKPVKIKPVALFGYKKKARTIAKKLGLPHYVSARKFYEKVVK